VQTGARGHPASYAMGTWGSYPGDERTEYDKNKWRYISFTQYVFMAWCLIKQWMHIKGVVLS